MDFTVLYSWRAVSPMGFAGSGGDEVAQEHFMVALTSQETFSDGDKSDAELSKRLMNHGDIREGAADCFDVRHNQEGELAATCSPHQGGESRPSKERETTHPQIGVDASRSQASLSRLS